MRAVNLGKLQTLSQLNFHFKDFLSDVTKVSVKTDTHTHAHLLIYKHEIVQRVLDEAALYRNYNMNVCLGHAAVCIKGRLP